MSPEQAIANQVAPEKPKQKGKIETLRDFLEGYKNQMAQLLPKHFSVERMFRVTALCLGKQPKLAECTPASVLGCVLESARLQLEPGAGAGETWILPWWNGKKKRYEAQLIIDYRAIIKMMRRGETGAETVIVDSVCENDVFKYGTNKDGPYLCWEPFRGARGKPTHYFSAAWSKVGGLLSYIVKSVEEIEQFHKARSQAKDKQGNIVGPWKSDPDWMYKKSVLRPLGKMIPGVSPAELQRAIALDERVDLGKAQDMGMLVDESETATPEDGEESAQPDMPKRASEEKKTTVAPEAKITEITEPIPAPGVSPAAATPETPKEIILAAADWKWRTFEKGIEIKDKRDGTVYFDADPCLVTAMEKIKGDISILFWPGDKNRHGIEQVKSVKK